MNESDLSRRYWMFQKRFWLGFFVPAIVHHAFGAIMQTFPGESLGLLCELDPPEGWTADDILNVLERSCAERDLVPALHFNPGWAAGHDFIAAAAGPRGYGPSHDIVQLRRREEMPDDPDAAAILRQERTWAGHDFARACAACFETFPARLRMIEHMAVRNMNHADNRFYMYYSGDTLAGFGATAFDAREKLGYCHTLGVMPPLRGLGFGRRIVDALCGNLAAQGAQHIFTAADSRNPAALALYRSAGFETFETWSVWLRSAGRKAA